MAKKPQDHVTQAKIDIGIAASQAVQVIADAAEKAKAVMEAAAAQKLSVSAIETAKRSGDHDLLVQLNTKMEDLKEDIAELKNGTSARIQQLEQEKVNTRDSYPVLYQPKVEEHLADHEKRIRSNETNITRIMTWGLAGMLALGVVEFFVTKFL